MALFILLIFLTIFLSLMEHIVDIKLRDKYVSVCQKENCDAIKMPLGNPLWDIKARDYSESKAKIKEVSGCRSSADFPFLTIVP